MWSLTNLQVRLQVSTMYHDLKAKQYISFYQHLFEATVYKIFILRNINPEMPFLITALQRKQKHGPLG